MSSSNIIKACGVAAVVAGLSFFMIALLSGQGPFGTSFISGSLGGPGLAVLLVVALLGHIAGVVGLHTLQRGSYGRLGTAGALIFLVGFVLLVIPFIAVRLVDVPVRLVDVSSGPVSSGPILAIGLLVIMILGVSAPFIGMLLLGVATLRARVLPRWFGVLLMVGLFIVAILLRSEMVLVGVLVYGAFWGVIGYVLLSSGGGTQGPRTTTQ